VRKINHSNYLILKRENANQTDKNQKLSVNSRRYL
jgi:hypothetical protein